MVDRIHDLLVDSVLLLIQLRHGRRAPRRKHVQLALPLLQLHLDLPAMERGLRQPVVRERLTVLPEGTIQLLQRVVHAEIHVVVFEDEVVGKRVLERVPYRDGRRDVVVDKQVHEEEPELVGRLEGLDGLGESVLCFVAITEEERGLARGAGDDAAARDLPADIF